MTESPQAAGLAGLLESGPWPLDGGLASELAERGRDITGHLWSARLLREDPDAIRAVHEAYLRSGARVVISASYQASRQGFAAVGLDARQADDLLRLSVDLARAARDAVATEPGLDPGLVAASVGPYGAIGHDGGEYRGRYGLSHAQLVAFHRERIDVLAAAGPDLLAVETIPDADEAAALVDVLADHADLPAWMTFTCGDDARLWAGQPIEEAVAAAAAAPSVRAVGVNCTAPELVTPLLERIAGSGVGLPVVVYPNAGFGWDPSTSTWTGVGTDVLPDPVVREWVDRGAVLVGGCCGLGPRAVRGIAGALGR